MKREKWLLLAACVAAAVVGSLPGRSPAPVGTSSTLEGHVVFVGDKLPDNPEVKPGRDQQYCQSKGPIKRNDLVVNPKNKGVRWVLVWLAPVKDYRNVANVLPIPASLRKVPEKQVISTGCTGFEPRVVGIREGTALVFENRDAIAHCAQVSTPVQSFAGLVPPGKDFTVKGLEARHLPGTVSCPIHSWMRGWIGVFRHPFFAVTDADGKFAIRDVPAGTWRLILWQEKVGWVVRNGGNIGKIIEVRKRRATTTTKIFLREP